MNVVYRCADNTTVDTVDEPRFRSVWPGKSPIALHDTSGASADRGLRVFLDSDRPDLRVQPRVAPT